jgi:hypothetical protein
MDKVSTTISVSVTVTAAKGRGFFWQTRASAQAAGWRRLLRRKSQGQRRARAGQHDWARRMWRHMPWWAESSPRYYYSINQQQITIFFTITAIDDRLCASDCCEPTTSITPPPLPLPWRSTQCRGFGCQRSHKSRAFCPRRRDSVHGFYWKKLLFPCSQSSWPGIQSTKRIDQLSS